MKHEHGMQAEYVLDLRKVGRGDLARAGGEVFILQARPITALPEPAPHPSRPVRMMAGLVSELVPERPDPLEVTTWLPTVYGFLVQFGTLLGIAFLPLDRVFVEEDGVVVRLSGRLPVRPRRSPRRQTDGDLPVLQPSAASIGAE